METLENLKKTKKAGRAGVLRRKRKLRRERGREKDNARASGEPTPAYTLYTRPVVLVRSYSMIMDARAQRRRETEGGWRES